MGLVYWLISLQGLRHAHPVMYVCWFALSAYLSVYGVLFVAVCRQMLSRSVPLWIAAPISWIGLECIRNYFATGISAAMLGHAMADVSVMIQVADLFGSYGVGFVIVAANVALFETLRQIRGINYNDQFIPAILAAVVLVGGNLTYGYIQLQYHDDDPLATFALIQRSEAVEYGQDQNREAEIYINYARDSVNALSVSRKQVHAVVWPESMYTGGVTWMMASDDTVPPEVFGGTKLEFIQQVKDQQEYFKTKSKDLLRALAGSHRSASSSAKPPQLIVGCGVVDFGEYPRTYSGIVNIDASGDLVDWYGKTHLVMFGEYVPIIGSIAVLKSLLPDGIGVTPGDGPKLFRVRNTSISPNICIETAVERVAVNHLAELRSRGELPDVIVTVTNDGWFDDSSVLDHHLRCAQLVAVGCRRPILSAANNGPTAWIDSSGRLVQHLDHGTNGSIIATPSKDDRISTYVRIGDWPARILALLCLIFLADGVRQSRKTVHDRNPAQDDLDREDGEPAGTVDT